MILFLATSICSAQLSCQGALLQACSCNTVVQLSCQKPPAGCFTCGQSGGGRDRPHNKLLMSLEGGEGGEARSRKKKKF